MQGSFKTRPSAKSKAAFFNEYLEAPNYTSLTEIVKAFPHLVSLTQDTYSNPASCHGLVIRSGNDDNIHKAIKYGIWTTTYKNKHRLEQYWKQYLTNKTETFLFFSAVKSGHFEGVARLASGYNDETFPFWWQNQNGKFKGHFQLEWIYVKDVTYRYFTGLKNQEGEEVSKSKDCDQISEQATRKMLRTFHDYSKNKSIFASFPFFDERQKNQLRTYDPEQFWAEQMKQMQLQQYYYGGVPMQSYFYPAQQVQQPMDALGKDLKAPVVPSNPGFQMNPVSKNKKNNKN